MKPKGRDFPIFQEAPKPTSPRLRPQAIIWDIDGVIVDSPMQKVDFSLTDEMNKLMDSHPPNWKLISMMNFFVNNQTEKRSLVNILCTGRPERFKPVTETWLHRHKVLYDDLWMRPDGDTRPDAEVKRAMLRAIQSEFDVWFVVEDRISVVRMWREEGILCLQPCEANY